MKFPSIKPKHSDAEKTLCKGQELIIKNHVEICRICKASFESYNKNNGISSTPPCTEMTKQLQNHIKNCKICNIANKNWNDDAISISPEMRRLAEKIGKGIIPNKQEMDSLIDELKKKLGDKK